MDLRQLQTLLAVAEVGSLKKAAKRLRIVETALSRQIRLLEAEFRTPLFRRHGRGLTPTEAGRHLIERTQPILAALEQLKSEMLSQHEAIAGKVAVGIPWLLLDTLSARLATGFMPRHPAVNISLVGGVSTKLQHMLQAGDLDVALFFDREATPGPSLKALFSERLLLAGDRSRAYRVDRPLPFSDLAGVSLALPDTSESFRRHLETLAKERGMTLDVRFEVGALQALRTLAANGLAHVFVSLHAVREDIESGKLSAAPVEEPSIVRTLMLGLSPGRKPSRAARHLADVLEEEIGALVSAGSFLTAD